MWILPLVGYVGVVLGVIFLTLAIASGLYYLSELVEERTVLSKKILTYLIYTVMGAELFLWLVDGFPLTWIALSIVSHGIYLQNLRRFPIVKLTDPIFITSCVLVLVNHFIWFRHFSAPPPPSRSSSSHPYSRLTADDMYNFYPSFTEIASFFGLCVWLVPFALFVSLSASENVLPSMGSEYATGEGSSYTRAGREPAINGGLSKASSGKSGLAKALVDGVRNWAGETGELMGFWKGEKTRHKF